MQRRRDVCRDEDEAPGFDRSILTGDSNGAAATDHVIDLILEVRSLPIVRPPRPDRQADAQLVGGEEVDIAMTFGVARL